MKKNFYFLSINLSKNEKRANYLSRFFGIFYEDLMKFWLEAKGFNIKGRPSVYDLNDRYLKKTFDYTVEKDGKYYIAEAKSYLAYQSFTQMELSVNLLESWLGYKDNFQFFCELGSKKEPYKKYRFHYNGISSFPDGKILIWAKIKKDEVKDFKKKYYFSYLFSIEEAIRDMIKENKNKTRKGVEYYSYIKNKKRWTDELFDVLLVG